jgi:Protein of unknown function (DUF4038)/Putative collagen-binding domain of a collagenase
MAVTVTATMSGTAANEHIYLWIRVLTSAVEAGGASSAGIAATGGTTVSASLTPAFSSSLPCFAVTGDGEAASFTALANNTVDSSSADPDTWEAGFGRYTGTVTAGTPLTFGVTAPGAGTDYSTWACYEVPPSGGGTPAVDGSSPALASATGAGIKTVTSASFTPPAGSVIVAMIAGGGSGGSGTFAVAVSGGSLTWTQRAGSATITDQDSFVFTATVPGGGAAVVSPASAIQPGLPGRGPNPLGPKRLAPASVIPPPPGAAAGATAGAGAVTGVATQIAGAGAAGAGAAAASTGKPYIAALGGTGAGYWTDQGGKPVLVIGDEAWALPCNAGAWGGTWQSDISAYVASRVAQGYNAVEVDLSINTTTAPNCTPGKTWDGVPMFLGTGPGAAGDPSAGLNTSYWQRVDYLIAQAAAAGMTVFAAMFITYDIASGGALNGMTGTQFAAYGTALGTRYGSTPNLQWRIEDDYFGSDDATLTAVLAAIRAAGDTHPVGVENYAESTSRRDISNNSAMTWGLANTQYQWVYSYNVAYFGIEYAYAETSPLTVIRGDGQYYSASGDEQLLRNHLWWSLASGSRGFFGGDNRTWQWASGSLAAVTTGTFQTAVIGAASAAFAALPGWQKLVPDTGNVFITAGRGTRATSIASGGGGTAYSGTGDNYVAGSIAADGSLAVIYCLQHFSITVDQAKMAAGYTATWMDPLTGATTTATAGSTYSSTAQGNNSGGNPDWVLVLQGPSGSTGTASAAGAGSAAAAATVTAPAAGAGTGTTATAVTQPVTASPAAAGAAAAKAAQAAAGAGAGAGTAADVATQIAGAGAAGAGSVTSTTAQVPPAGAAGAGSVTAVVTQAAAAALAGAGVAGVPPVTQPVTAGAGAAGAAAAVTGQAAAASAAGAGSVTAAGGAPGSGTAAIAGAGAVTGAAAQIAAATPTAAGAAAAAGTQAAGAIAAAASTATPALATQSAAAGITGTGAASAAGASPGSGSAAITGTGAATAAAGQAAIGAGAGAGTAAAAAAQAAKAAAGGTGTAAGAGVITGTAAVTGAGGAAADVTQAAAASLAAAGTLAALAAQAATAALAAAGSATAAGNIQAAFTVGTLTAGDQPAAALTASTAAGSTLTAGNQRTGGPG